MTFDELFQYYANIGITSRPEGIQTIAPINTVPDLSLPVVDVPQERKDDDKGIMSIPTNQIDYTQVPSLLSQYMRPTGIVDVAKLLFNPITYVAGKGFDYARDQSLAQDVQEMGIGFGGATSQDRAGGGGFGGDTAGGFSESDPTATEGSF
ncbi:MAG: hypothetical protein VW810_00265 [Pelagibacteraceae bacterium]